jgi:colanic acid/amylovoran biosynthesis glycosyltransferase
MTLRVAILLGSFPLISETFILRQITGLLDRGHDVRILASHVDHHPSIVHPEVTEYGLYSRTTSMDLPDAELAELSAFPLSGKTWIAGAEHPLPNWRRLVQAAPTLFRNALLRPGLLVQVLSTHEYREGARSLSALYRLDKCSKFSHFPDVSHAHFGNVANDFRFVRRLWNAPLVASFHGYDFTTLVRTEGPDLYTKLFQTVDLVTANSQFTARSLEQLGCPPHKIRLLPVGLDPQKFAYKERTLSPSEPVRILSIGRLVPKKGHEFVIRALAQLRDAPTDIEYLIVGDGHLRGALQSLATELGIASRVHFYGAVSGDRMPDILARSHLFVMPSVNIDGDQEGQGLALQEAQAAGLPVITTDHSALPEGLLEGVSGYIVPERDVGALAEKILFLVNNPQLWPALGRAGRKYASEHYDIAVLNERLSNIYIEAIQAFRTRRTGA